MNPVFAGDAGLPENPYQKIHTDLGSVGIRDGQDEIATDHVRVFPAMERTVETKYFQPADQFRPRDRKKLMPGHSDPALQLLRWCSYLSVEWAGPAAAGQ